MNTHEYVYNGFIRLSLCRTIIYRHKSTIEKVTYNLERLEEVTGSE